MYTKNDKKEAKVMNEYYDGVAKGELPHYAEAEGLPLNLEEAATFETELLTRKVGRFHQFLEAGDMEKAGQYMSSASSSVESLDHIVQLKANQIGKSS